MSAPEPLSFPSVPEAVSVKLPWVVRRLPSDFEFRWGRLGEAKVGDLLLCEVEKLSLHGRLETQEGRRAKLYEGDHVVCTPGNRYASSLLEGVAEICGDHADMLSASGVCGRVVARNDKTNIPTSLRVLAQAYVDAVPLNLRSFAMKTPGAVSREPFWFLVVGTDMDVGKTSACAALIYGMVKAGYRVAAAKLTGTASGRDLGAYHDAGAMPVHDFLDLGLPSTAGCPVKEVNRVAYALMDHVAAAGVDVGVLEVADGVHQFEAEGLIDGLGERGAETAVIVAARESLSAVWAVDRIARAGLRPAAVSGVVTSSPLARREVEARCGVECIRTAELADRGVDLMAAAGIAK
jgi:hypothetical protein